MKSKNMLNVMEFREAKDILEEEAKPLLQQLITKYNPKCEEGEVEILDLTKDLIDNRYSFQYRKKYALYLKKFAFYDQAIEVLNVIIADEI
jgi:hypothetical protein